MSGIRTFAIHVALLGTLTSCESPKASAPSIATRAPSPASVSERGHGPAAGQLAAWLEAFNSGDAATLAGHQTKHFAYGVASERAANVDSRLAPTSGAARFVLRSIDASGTERAVAILEERSSGQFARAIVEVDPAPPHQVTWFQVSAIPTPDEFRPARTSEADAIVALRAELEAAAEGDRFSGTVLVAKDGAPIFSAVHGFADRERRAANQLDTRFRIGSMNKMFTAVAVLQLVQARKLALEDRVGDLLPDHALDASLAHVTVHQLMTHTGGTGDIFGPEYESRRRELRTIRDYVKLHAGRPLRSVPGARWEYSNYGFILLGAIIEAVSGEDYHARVGSQVFRPAGMSRTASPPEDRLDPGRSLPYTRQNGGSRWVSSWDTLPYRASSAGGGDSTVGDLLRFANALSKHELLDAEHTALLTTGKIEMPRMGRYAYGFTDRTWRGVRCVGHEGGSPGMNGELAICDSGYTVVVLANLDPPAASRMASFVLDRLPAR